MSVSLSLYIAGVGLPPSIIHTDHIRSMDAVEISGIPAIHANFRILGPHSLTSNHVRFEPLSTAGSALIGRSIAVYQKRKPKLFTYHSGPRARCRLSRINA